MKNKELQKYEEICEKIIELSNELSELKLSDESGIEEAKIDNLFYVINELLLSLYYMSSSYQILNLVKKNYFDAGLKNCKDEEYRKEVIEKYLDYTIDELEHLNDTLTKKTISTKKRNIYI